MPSDVTDDMLENIIDDFVSNKVYDQGPKGSTCHQKAKKTQVHGYHGKKKSTGDKIFLINEVKLIKEMHIKSKVLWIPL